MNKIKSLFKASPIAVAVAGLAILAIAGVASAALVNYLSNYTQVTTNVTSPITMSVNLGENGTPSSQTVLPIGATFGGSDITFTTVAQNNVNKEIKGYNVMVLRETDGKSMTGKEIAEVMYRDNQNVPSSISILSTLAVVELNGTLTKLSAYIAANRSDPKLVLISDYSNVTPNAPTGAEDLSTIAANAVFWNVYTATLNTATVGTYEIYSQYVAGTPSDLAAYAASQYNNF